MEASEILDRYRADDGTLCPDTCWDLLRRYAHHDLPPRVTALEALAAAHHLATAAREVYGPLVAAAQAEGASWADIGAALGTSRQAAHTTYRHADAPDDSRREIMLSLFRQTPAVEEPPVEPRDVGRIVRFGRIGLYTRVPDLTIDKSDARYATSFVERIAEYAMPYLSEGARTGVQQRVRAHPDVPTGVIRSRSDDEEVVAEFTVHLADE